ncbi:hypothetical protein L195_g049402, partial [Trifolium pratense]
MAQFSFLKMGFLLLAAHGAVDLLFILRMAQPVLRMLRSEFFSKISPDSFELLMEMDLTLCCLGTGTVPVSGTGT